MDEPLVDPTRCPLCAEDNKCGAEQGLSTCWCHSAPIASELLARVPAAMKDRACICEACAAKLASASTSSAGE